MPEAKKILAAQIEIKTGAVEDNYNKAFNIVKDNLQYDFIVFPEMTLSGYNCGDLFEKKPFIHDCEDRVNSIAKLTENNKTVVIIGSPRLDDNHKLYNSAFVLADGKIIGIYDKQKLANDYHHEDRKYFTAGKSNKVLYYNGIKFGVLICEDLWNSYSKDLIRENAEEGAEVIFSLNFSYFTFDKKQQRANILHNIHNIIPILYVNSVGIGDISKNFMCYDGGSLISHNKNNEHYVTQVAPRFKEHLATVILNDSDLELTSEDYTSNILENKSKYGMIANAIIYSIKHIYEQCHIENAQVHISGGIDSALVGYFAVKAMDKDHVIFITQPSKNNGKITLNNAQVLATNLGVELKYEPIIEYIDVYKKNNPDAKPGQMASFEATLRKALGISATHNYKSGLLSCGNHTENALGWNSFGDIGNYCGILQPIGDLSKTEIFKLAEYINKAEGVEVIPKCLYDGSLKPAAELEDSNEDPFDYVIMSRVCELFIREGMTPKEVINAIRAEANYSGDLIVYTLEDITKNVYLAWKKIKTTAYKRAQGSPVLILSNRSFGFSMRDTILNNYTGFNE